MLSANLEERPSSVKKVLNNDFLNGHIDSPDSLKDEFMKVLSNSDE